MQQLTIWNLPSSVADAPLLFPNPTKAQKLQMLARGMSQTIQAKSRPSIAQLNLTRRRARIADSLEQEGLRLEQIQSWLLAIADLAEQGTLPTILEGISTKTQLEVLAAMSKDSWGEKDIQQVFSSNGWYADWVKKLRSAGICTPKLCQKAINALRELGVGERRESEAHALEIAQLKREAVLQGIPDYFPTPKHLLEQMMHFACLQLGMRVLEPSAGSGSICLAV